MIYKPQYKLFETTAGYRNGIYDWKVCHLQKIKDNQWEKMNNQITKT